MGAGLKRQGLPLLVWLLVGLLLRFHNLALKPPWTDEFSTLVFGLGHGFTTVPLSQIIGLEQILAPLEWNPIATVQDTLRVLLTESNHPPLYFVLTHQWVDGIRQMSQIWHGVSSTPYVGFELARSLSACFGALGVPAIYLTAWCMWRSPSIAHFAALLMALSPFGIYLAQEARHYTLTILWLLGSLACLVAVVKHIYKGRLIPPWLGLAWVLFNGLGLATHYFFALSLLAELVALLWCGWAWALPQGLGPLPLSHATIKQLQPWSQVEYWLEPSYWRNWGRAGAIALATALTGTIWLPSLLQMRHGRELVRWVQSPITPDNWSQPLVHTLASIGSMIYLLPIQGVGVGMMVLSALALLIVTVATIWAMVRAIAQQRKMVRQIPDPSSPTHATETTDPGLEAINQTLPLMVMGRVGLSAIVMMVVVTYGFGFNISPVFRYHFIYFPTVLLLMAWGFAQLWNQCRWLVGLILSVGLCGAITVSSNLGYQKLHRPDLVVQTVISQSHHPPILAISHQSHGQTGRLMAVAWQIRSQGSELESPQFFLDHQPCDRPGAQNCNSPSSTLRHTLDQFHHPYDLWLMNYLGTTDLKQHHCTYHTTQRFDGYKVQHYTCLTQQYATVENNITRRIGES